MEGEVRKIIYVNHELCRSWWCNNNVYKWCIHRSWSFIRNTSCYTCVQFSMIKGKICYGQIFIFLIPFCFMISFKRNFVLYNISNFFFFQSNQLISPPILITDISRNMTSVRLTVVLFTTLSRWRKNLRDLTAQSSIPVTSSKGGYVYVSCLSVTARSAVINTLAMHVARPTAAVVAAKYTVSRDVGRRPKIAAIRTARSLLIDLK